MKVCILIPMYNEEVIIQRSVETIYSYIKNLPPIIHLLLVNDGSSDRTESIVKDVIGRLDSDYVKLVSHSINKGYGAALRTGNQFAIEHNFDYVLFMDSDLTNHPKYLVDFYEKMLEGWDYIKATRYSKGGGVDGVPMKHYIISRSGKLFAKMISRLPLTDMTNGFRAVKVDILRKINLKENHFSIIFEEIMKARNITDKFCEIPYILGTRDKTARPTKFRYGPSTFWNYLKYLRF